MIPISLTVLKAYTKMLMEDDGVKQEELKGMFKMLEDTQQATIQRLQTMLKDTDKQLRDAGNGGSGDTGGFGGVASSWFQSPASTAGLTSLTTPGGAVRGLERASLPAPSTTGSAATGMGQLTYLNRATSRTAGETSMGSYTREDWLVQPVSLPTPAAAALSQSGGHWSALDTRHTSAGPNKNSDSSVRSTPLAPFRTEGVGDSIGIARPEIGWQKTVGQALELGTSPSALGRRLGMSGSAKVHPT